MKLKFLIIILFSIKAFSQQYEFTFGKMISVNEEELNNIKDVNIKNNIIDMNNSFVFVDYQLIVNNNYAIFKYLEKINAPSFNKRVITMGGGEGVYYFDLINNRLIHKTELLGDIYYVEKKIDSYKWKITNLSKKINGFTCYKAETSFSYSDFRGNGTIELVAWFCPEFPFPYGPDIYFGLPGLVFEAYQKNSKIKFYLKKIEKFENEINIEIPNKKTISEEEMTQIFNKAMNDLTNQN